MGSLDFRTCSIINRQKFKYKVKFKSCASYYTTNKVIPWQGRLKSQVKNDILLKENSRLIGKVLVKV